MAPSHRRSIIGLLAVLASVAPLAAADWEPPPFYHKHDGPIFNVLKEADDIAQRRYQSEKWVAVNITGKTYDDAFTEGTKQLDSYWKGDNEPHQKVDKTAPRAFMLLYPTGQGRSLATTFTVEKFLPHELHAGPPSPLAQELKVIDVPQYDVWVKTFGGFAPEDEVINQVFDFLDKLRQDGVTVDSSVVGLAIYDEPAHLVNRHNEIWVWEKQPSPSTLVKAWLQRLKAAVWRWGANQRQQAATAAS